MISDDYDGENRNILYLFKNVKKCVIHVYKKSPFVEMGVLNSNSNNIISFYKKKIFFIDKDQQPI